MKKTLLILTLLMVAVAVIIFLLFSSQDERQVRRNIASLSDSISALLEKDGIAALAEARKIGSFFTEDCQIAVGDPVPEIHGREELISAAYATRKARGIVADEVEVAFYDVSVTIAENEVMAISIKTAVATGATGREIRNIKMHWKKTEGRWEITTAKSIPILY